MIRRLRNIVEADDFDPPPLGNENTIERRGLRLVEQKIKELEDELRTMMIIREALNRHT